MSDSEKLDLIIEMLVDIYAVTQAIASKVGMELIPNPRVKKVISEINDH